jgi:hypothetical protein
MLKEKSVWGLDALFCNTFNKHPQNMKYNFIICSKEASKENNVIFQLAWHNYNSLIKGNIKVLQYLIKHTEDEWSGVYLVTYSVKNYMLSCNEHYLITN